MTRWIDENAFFVLELAPDCSPMDVERQGQKLLAMLELGLESSRTYSTPNGERTRGDQEVRHAMAELRDPRKRIVHELWAGTASVKTGSVETGSVEAGPSGSEAAAGDTTSADETGTAWPTAFEDMGWRRS